MRLVESNKVDNSIISSLLEDEQEGRYYEVSIGFGGYIGVEEEYRVYAKNKADAVGEALDNPGSEAEQDLSVDNIEDNGDGSYTCTVSFAGTIGADNEYTVYADSEEEAEMNAIEEAKSDLEVITVDGEEFSYDDDSNFTESAKLNESILTELDRSNIMNDQKVIDIINSFSLGHRDPSLRLEYKIKGNQVEFEDGTKIKFEYNDNNEIEYYFVNGQGDTSKAIGITKEDVKEFYTLVRNELENTIKVPSDFLNKAFDSSNIKIYYLLSTDDEYTSNNDITSLIYDGDKMKFEFPGWGSVYNVFRIYIYLDNYFKFKVLGIYGNQYMSQDIRRVILSGKYDLASHSLKVRKPTRR